MASVDQFEITVVGRGGHAAAPQQAIDPVLIAAHLVTALQSLVSRRRNPFEEGVVSVTQINAGHAFNVIPERAELRGTVRTFGGSAPPDKKGAPHHSPAFDIDEESLVVGAELVTRTVVRYLEQAH